MARRRRACRTWQRLEQRRCKRRVMLESLEPRWLLSVAPNDRPFAADLSHSQAPHQLLVGLSDPYVGAYRSGGEAALLQSAASLFQGMQAWDPEENFSVQVLQDHGSQLFTRWWLPDRFDLANVMSHVGNISGVTFAEPNYDVSIMVQPNDPRFSDLWGLHNTGQTGGKVDADIDAPEAWDQATGSSSIVVGIIDTGIDYRHVDLYRNIWINQGEIPNAVRATLSDVDNDGLITFWDLNDPANSGRVTDRNGNGYIDGGDLLNDPAWENGADDDGNSFADDLVGWDFINNDNDPLDDNNHGTHVAGTIGGVGNNGTGVVGVNWRVQMVGIKFLGFDGGGSTADAIRSVDYATTLKNSGVNIKLTSNSWGGGGFSAGLRSSIQAAGNAGQMFVAAAGNSSVNTDQFPAYPASYDLPNIISVASTNHLDNLSSFSNYGATTVDLAAPGESVLSTVRNNGYGTFSGTSMATPHVAGVAALAWSVNDTATHNEIRDAIFQGVNAIPALAGRMVTGGRLNAKGTLDLVQNSKGRISLDRAVYNLSSVVTIRVTDADVNTNPNAPDSLQVEIKSTTEAAPEFVTLVETGNSTNTFTGTIPLGTGVAVPGDAILQVAHADQIVATYRDAFDGTGPADVTAQATVDGQPPLISNVSATPSSRRANIVWTTDEGADSVVHYGTSADNLNQQASVGSLVTSHSVTLTGLLPLTTYFYRAQSSDAAGNKSQDVVRQFTTLDQPPILFVDDDIDSNLETFFTNALDAKGYSYDMWNTASTGTPAVGDLSVYEVVIWNTGANYTSTGAGLTTAEQNSLAGYLDQGGKLFLSGQDILFNGVSPNFMMQYLHVASFANDIGGNALGVAGDPISDGMNLPLSPPPQFEASYADILQPNSGATGAFFSTAGHTQQPYNSVRYPDVGDAPHRVVFFAFPFEAISTTATDPNNQATVMDRVMQWLSVQPGPGVAVFPTAGLETSENGTTASFTVKLRSAPAADVSIQLTTSDASEGLLQTASGPATSQQLLFTPANWNQAQTVTVVGVDDSELDGPISFSIQLAPTQSSDPTYDGINPDDVSLTNLDNEAAPIKVASGVLQDVTPGQWVTVQLPESYTSMVVVTSASYGAGDPPAIIRVRNAAGDKFEVRLESAGWATPNAADIHYLVVEEGKYTQAEHGVKMEAVKFVSNFTDRSGSWFGEARQYQNSYTQPVVVGQVMSANDLLWSSFWSSGFAATDPPSSNALRVGKHVGEDWQSRAPETLGYIVIETGGGQIGDVGYLAAIGSDTVQGFDDAPPYTYAITTPFNDIGGAIVSQAGMDGTNGGWPVLYGANAVTTTQLKLAIDEDQALDNERAHTTEQVAYIIFEAAAPTPPPPPPPPPPIQLDLDQNDSSGATGADFAGSYREDDGPTPAADPLDATLVVGPGVTQLSQLTVQITNLANGSDETLSADTTGTAITASYSNGTLVLSGNDVPANYQSVLRTVRYHNASQNPATSNRLITFVATDGTNNSNTGTATLSIQAVNDPPQLLRNNPLQVNEGATAVIGNSLLAVTDVDNPPSALQFTIVSGPAQGNVTVNGSAASSFTQADIDNNIVRYVHNGSETTADQFTFKVNDGSGGTIGDTIFVINVSPVNDAPVNSVPGQQTTNKNTARIFSAANGNAVTTSDADAGSQTVQVQLQVTSGTATVGTSGVTVTGNGSSNVTISGAITAINAALNGMSFQPATNFVGTANLRVITNDQGHSGSGGPKTDTDDIPINVVEPPVGNPRVQVGSLFMSSGDGWRTIVLPSAHQYASMVVVISTNYERFSPALVPRVRNAQGRSFDLKLESLDPFNPVTPGVLVYYIVMEEGVYNQAQHGVKLEARKVASTITDRAGSWQAQVSSYQNTYQNPVVIGQVMTANDSNWSVFWSRGATVGDPPSPTSLRVGKHVGEDPNRTRAAETIGYFVIEAGIGTIGTLHYVAGLGADTVLGVDNNPPYTYNLPAFLSQADGAVVSQAAMDGANGSWAMLYGQSALSATQLRLAVDEDQKNDIERAHTHEQVAYFVWDVPGSGGFGSGGNDPGNDPGGGGGGGRALRQLDVSRNGIVDPHDMVLVLSHLVRHGSGTVTGVMPPLDDDRGWTHDMLDADGNQLIQPADIAWIAQHLARRGSTSSSPGAEGESPPALDAASFTINAASTHNGMQITRRESFATADDEAETAAAATQPSNSNVESFHGSSGAARRWIFSGGWQSSLDWEQGVDAALAQIADDEALLVHVKR